MTNNIEPRYLTYRALIDKLHFDLSIPVNKQITITRVASWKKKYLPNGIKGKIDIRDYPLARNYFYLTTILGVPGKKITNVERYVKEQQIRLLKYIITELEKGQLTI
jgi:hypothetical protein